VVPNNQAAKLEIGGDLLDKCVSIRSARQCNKDPSIGGYNVEILCKGEELGNSPDD
jgi:hypothetical protein